MKPLALFQFSAEDGPGYCASFLDRHSIPWRLVRVDRGEAVPENMNEFSGLVLMGGPMSAYDPLPWIPPVLDLLRDAVTEGRPCVGHCLGGQLMSMALGGEVKRHTVKEIGWHHLYAEDVPEAREWLGAGEDEKAAEWTAFQWHGDTFSIPPGATRILTGSVCANQAYVIGKSLGMQCHTEMTVEAIATWCRAWEAECADPKLPSVQTPERMMELAEQNLPMLRELADRLYARWIAGLERG